MTAVVLVVLTRHAAPWMFKGAGLRVSEPQGEVRLLIAAGLGGNGVDGGKRGGAARLSRRHSRAFAPTFLAERELPTLSRMRTHRFLES